MNDIIFRNCGYCNKELLSKYMIGFIPSEGYFCNDDCYRKKCLKLKENKWMT